MKYPNERLGNDYTVNWTLVRFGIPPQGTNAFRNLHSRHLAMYCQGTAGNVRNYLFDYSHTH